MKFIQSATLLSIFLCANTLFASNELKCVIEYPKSPETSAQWRNHHGDAIIQVTCDGEFLYPINKDDYKQWDGKLETKDFIILPEGTVPQKFATKEEYREFLVTNCADHETVQRALAYEAKIEQYK